MIHFEGQAIDRKYFRNATIIETLYLFFLCSTISNAGYSITYALLFLCAMVHLIKKNGKFKIPEMHFLAIYFLFTVTLLIAAFLRNDAESIQATLKYIYWTIPFFIIYIFNESYFFNKSVQWGTSLAAIVLSGYALYIFFFLPHDGRIGGFFRSPNDYAMVAEMFTPFIFASWWYYNKIQEGKFGIKFSNVLVISAFFMSVIGIFLTKSRGGIAGFLFGAVVTVVIWTLLNKEHNYHISKIKIFICSCIICLVASIFMVITLQYCQRSYDNERVLLFKSSYNMWSDNKIYGVGYSRWKEEYQSKYIYPEAKEPNLPMPHNTFAEFFSTTGLIGGLGYSIFVFGSIILLLRLIRKNPSNPYLWAMFWVSVAIFVHGLVDAGLRNKFVVRLYFAFWGVTLASLYSGLNWKKSIQGNIDKEVR